MCRRNTNRSPLTHPLAATQACALTRSPTGDILLRGTTPNQLSHTGQGCSRDFVIFFLCPGHLDPIIFWGIILDVQRSCKENTENSCIPLTQFPLKLPSHITMCWGRGTGRDHWFDPQAGPRRLEAPHSLPCCGMCFLLHLPTLPCPRSCCKDTTWRVMWC